METNHKSTKQKPIITRRDSQTILTTMKMAATAGVLSLTLAGWGALAAKEAKSIAVAQAAEVQTIQTAAKAAEEQPSLVQPTPTVPPTTSPFAADTVPTPEPVAQLDIVQWVQNRSGLPVAVVRDDQGRLWYVLGSDVDRIEQGLSPEVQPQLVQRQQQRTTTRTRHS
jgi:hypothetical protein